jgi:hypothetical protein
VLDSEKRPITAGGFVKSGPVIFKDISEKAVLTTWNHKMGAPQKQYILETIGSGVALIDYDRGGWLDIYRHDLPGRDVHVQVRGRGKSASADHCCRNRGKPARSHDGDSA